MDEVQDLKGSFGERSALADQLSSTKAALEEARGKLEGLEGTAEEAARLLEQNEVLKEKLDKTEGQVRTRVHEGQKVKMQMGEGGKGGVGR
jgi:DNA repair exonuclease SbcCD ATPase subunit